MTVLIETDCLSAPWKFRNTDGPTPDLHSLRLAYPEVYSLQDRHSLLHQMARKLPITSVSLYEEDGIWIYEGQLGFRLSGIEVTSNLPIENELRKLSNRFQNQTVNTSVKKQFYQNIRSIMAARGFFKPNIKIEEVHNESELEYHVAVKEGRPCRYTEVKTSLRLPRGFRFKIRKGDICSSTSLLKEINRLGEALREEGFNTIDIKAQKFDITSAYTGTLTIGGSIEPKIKYSINQSERKDLLSEIISIGEFSSIDGSSHTPDGMKSEIESSLSERGYVESEVSYDGPFLLSEFETEYKINVKFGQKYTVSGIYFDGLSVFNRDDAINIMDLTSFLNIDAPLNIESINNGIELLTYEYQKLGYWDIKVFTPKIIKRKDTSTSDIYITLKEGLPRIFSGANIEGDTNLALDDIIDMTDVEQGDPLPRERIAELKKKLKEIYVNQGYLYAEIIIDVNASKHRREYRTTLDLKIIKGERVKIGKISVQGLYKTAEEVVIRELRFETGDTYNPDSIKKTRNALLNLGIFRSVLIHPTNRAANIEKPAILDLTIDIQEGASGSVGFGPGLDISKGGRYSFEFAYNNLGGKARRVSLYGALSQEAHQHAIDNRMLLGRKVSAGYVEPYILGLPVDLRFSTAHKATASEYWKLTYAGEVQLVHNLRFINLPSSVSTFYRQDISKTEGFIGDEDSDQIRIGSVGLRTSLDLRDQVSWPTEGMHAQVELSFARDYLGGHTKFFKWDTKLSTYYSLFPRVIIALGGIFTSYEEIEEVDQSYDILPQSELLNAGGTDLVRGFKHQLGPYINKPNFDSDGQLSGYKRQIIGGNQRAIVKLETRYRAFETGAFSLFADSGNTFLSTDQMREYEEKFENENRSIKKTIRDNISYKLTDLFSNPSYLYSKHYLSYGIAYNYFTPLGSIKLALAWPWRDPNEDECKRSDLSCYTRSKSDEEYYKRGKLELDIGARF